MKKKTNINRHRIFMRRMAKDSTNRRVYWEKQHHKLFRCPLPFFSMPVLDEKVKTVIRRFPYYGVK